MSHLGFMLLETFEYTMESATQQVEMVKITNMEYPWFTTLGHRVLRQQKTVKESFLSPCFTFSVIRFMLKESSRESESDSFLSIVQDSQRVTMTDGVELQGNVGVTGWAKMAKACLHLGVMTFRASKECMLGGESGDLKTIWDALTKDWGSWYVGNVLIGGTLSREGMGRTFRLKGRVQQFCLSIKSHMGLSTYYVSCRREGGGRVNADDC